MEYPFCRTNMEKITCTNWKLCSSWIYMDLPHSGGRFYQFIDRLSLRPLLDSMAAPLIISELIYGHWVAELNIYILALFFHPQPPPCRMQTRSLQIKPQKNIQQ